jgi:hypothetical protein
MAGDFESIEGNLQKQDDDLIAQAWTAHAATIEQIKLILSNFQKQLQNTSIKWTMNAREDGGDLESGRVS